MASLIYEEFMPGLWLVGPFFKVICELCRFQ